MGLIVDLEGVKQTLPIAEKESHPPKEGFLPKEGMEKVLSHLA